VLAHPHYRPASDQRDIHSGRHQGESRRRPAGPSPMDGDCRSGAQVNRPQAFEPFLLHKPVRHPGRRSRADPRSSMSRYRTYRHPVDRSAVTDDCVGPRRPFRHVRNFSRSLTPKAVTLASRVSLFREARPRGPNTVSVTALRSTGCRVTFEYLDMVDRWDQLGFVVRDGDRFGRRNGRSLPVG